MTRNQAKELWPVMKAWGEGATVEFATRNCGKWTELDGDPSFAPAWGSYRIRPKPKLRAWTTGTECGQALPVIRKITSGDMGWSWQVLAITHMGFVVSDYKGTETLSWRELCELYERSYDGCKTWQRCGITEES